MKRIIALFFCIQLSVVSLFALTIPEGYLMFDNSKTQYEVVSFVFGSNSETYVLRMDDTGGSIWTIHIPQTYTDMYRFTFVGGALEEGRIEQSFTDYKDYVSNTLYINRTATSDAQMNDGEIFVRGSIGDAAGYAMRGGKIFVKGNAGYRAGIHMKAYGEKMPVIVIGGAAGSFLGEYQAGGVIVVLGLNIGSRKMISNFPCTGMHGGRMYARGKCEDILFPPQVSQRPAEKEELEEIRRYVSEYCAHFGGSVEEIMDSPFTVVTPDTSNPYNQLYVPN